MASLVEELISVLTEEEKIYQQLLSLGEQKREVLIHADVDALEKITAQEQLSSDELVALSNRQVQLLKDVATVLGKTEEKMTVTRLIELLATQPKEQELLLEARDRLLETAGAHKKINDENVVLIQQAIELNEFDLTLLRSMRQAPETANYDRNAYNTGSILGGSGFNATS